ncbi:MAG: NUDIX domain-containing protein [Acidimicrobiaceae bacterium]|nr:NUDIX domain-containing protein [Acidimicrobiaceae bacterium]
MEVSDHDLYRWVEALSSVARTGLAFTESQFERERYEEILHVAADIRHRADGEDDEQVRDEIVARWLDWVEPGTPGYVTPKVAVGAIVTNEKNQLLLIQRADSGVWLYPTGWCDPGYSAPEVVVKEVKEETGIDAEVVRLIGVLDGMRLGASKVALYSLVFLCRATGGELSPHPLECLDAGWFDADSLPVGTLGADRWAPAIFRAIRGETTDVFYDDLRQPVWKGEP